MSKRGGDLEILAEDFLGMIFKELNFTVVRRRVQLSGSQDGYDTLIEIIDSKYLSRLIYTECKDYTSELNYTDAMIKLPQLASTHDKIDLVLFISPRRKFSNIFEETRNKPFLESLANRQLKVAFLTPDTDVEKYFMLYPEIYERAYKIKAPILSATERDEILNQFDKFIFSDRNLQKIVIDESDRNSYIGAIQAEKHHIRRTLRGNQKSEDGLYVPISKQKTLLSEMRNNKKGIILLGNPGYGKTSELKQLAAEMWNEREATGKVPFFRSLKNFTLSSRIEEFLPKNFRLISGLVVIYDGVDEIGNITDFSSKLRSLISDNKVLFDSNVVKFVISCRTNIYRKYIKNIEDLDIYFLNEVSIYSGLNFLNAKYNLDMEEQRTFDSYKNREILENPFYLDLLGNYYKTHRRVLTSKVLLIREFVDSRLDHDRTNKFSNDAEFDKERIISYTQKIAFALEAMQKPFLTAGEIKRVANIDEVSLAKNSFLEENLAGIWSFVLKNIQEYFVASTLCELDFEGIVKIIKIDSETDKIHPTWHNVVTFLLNLIPDERLYGTLIDWLLDNDFELLFNADSDRISDEIKSKVLQNFFERNCIEDNLWINDLKSIALFSECGANIEYLLSASKDSNLHRRARMSALKLLSFMDIPKACVEPTKTAVIGIIKENSAEGYAYLVEDAIYLAKSQRLNEDSVFFGHIIELLNENDEKEIVRAIVSSVSADCLSENIGYFLEILDKATGIKAWNTQSKYGSLISTKDNIFSLFTKIEDGKVLLNILEYSIDRQKKHRFKESMAKEFSGHLKEFFMRNSQFNPDLVRIVSDAVIDGKANHYDDDLLLGLAVSCSIETQVFDLVIESVEANSGDRHFLAAIITAGDFEKVLQQYISGYVNYKFLQQFRNVLSHRDFDMSKQFEDYIEAGSGYVFNEKCSHEELAESSEHWRTKDQKEFDVLFDSNAIEKQIHKLYDYLDKTELGYKDIDRFYHKYYKNFELQKNVTVHAKQLLYEILRDNYSGNEKLDKADIQKEILDAKLKIIQDILNSLPRDGRSKNIEISEDQKQFVKNWCNEKTPLVMQYYANRLSLQGDEDCVEYFIFKAIYKFQKFFLFDMDQELLLNMLWFNSFEKGIRTEYLQGIVPVEKVNERIKYNLVQAKLSPSNFCNHLKYCKEKKIDIQDLNLDLKAKVYSYLNGGRYYYAGEIIENFFSEDLQVLEEFLNHDFQHGLENTRSIYDSIIALLAKAGREDFARNFLLSKHTNLVADGIYTEKEIVRKLISLNYQDAFSAYGKIIREQMADGKEEEFVFRNQEWLNFTHADRMDVLVSIFHLCLSVQNLDKLFGNHYSPLRICFETIIGICKANDEESCINTLELLDSIQANILKAQNADLFYLNKLKIDIQELFYSHKSKPYKMEQVLKMLDENKYLFI